jgi:hypothetical protein
MQRDLAPRLRLGRQAGVAIAEAAVERHRVAGSTHVRLFGELGGTRVRRQLINTARRLHQIGGPRAARPAPTLPRVLLRKLHRTERAYAQLGSIDAAAQRLGVPRRLVALRLEFARAVRALPQVRTIACPRR